MITDAKMSFLTDNIFIRFNKHRAPPLFFTAGFTDFSANMFVGVFNTLALVRFRNTPIPDISSDRADELFIDAVDSD